MYSEFTFDGGLIFLLKLPQTVSYCANVVFHPPKLTSLKPANLLILPASLALNFTLILVCTRRICKLFGLAPVCALTIAHETSTCEKHNFLHLCKSALSSTGIFHCKTVVSLLPILIMRLQNGQLMFSQPHCRVELFGALMRFTVRSPV